MKYDFGIHIKFKKKKIKKNLYSLIITIKDLSNY